MGNEKARELQKVMEKVRNLAEGKLLVVGVDRRTVDVVTKGVDLHDGRTW